MSGYIKRWFKRNTRNVVFKGIGRFGIAINRLYENRNYDIRSNGELNVLRKLQPNCIFDVGANSGEYSLLVHQLVPATIIHAFEPIEGPYSELEKSIQSLSNHNIQTHQFGLSDSTGEQCFKLYGESAHTSLIEIQGMGREVKERQSIKVMKGDEFLREHQIEAIDLLKIDVEGAEMKVLEGFSEAFDQKKIRACQFEYGYANITSHKLLIDFHQFFETRGYVIGKIYPKKVDFRSYHVKHEDFLGPNYLAVDQNEKELIQTLSK